MFFSDGEFFCRDRAYPVGGFALSQAWKTDRRYLMLAAFPVAFGLPKTCPEAGSLGLNGQYTPPEIDVSFRDILAL